MVFSKWGDQPHWECDAARLGSDEHGTWLGIPLETLMSRPGVSFTTEQLQVVLVPRASPFVATFYRPGGPCEVYVDITTAPVWEGTTVRAVDLDLDVVRGWTGRVWVDDEDEFADHQLRFGYPQEVVRLAVVSSAEVLAAVGARRPPYDGVVSERWMDRLDAAMMGR
jgi:uncharacterized protein